MQATRFQDRDFSLTQMVIPRKHKTIRQLRERHERDSWKKSRDIKLAFASKEMFR